MGVAEAGQHDAPAGLTLDRARRQLELLPAIATSGPEDRAVARGEPAIVDRAHVASGGADPRPLRPGPRGRGQTRPPRGGIGPPPPPPRYKRPSLTPPPRGPAALMA